MLLQENLNVWYISLTNLYDEYLVLLHVKFFDVDNPHSYISYISLFDEYYLYDI